MTSPYITAALAEQHTAELVRQAQEHRLARAGKARSPKPTTPVQRRRVRWLRAPAAGAAA